MKVDEYSSRVRDADLSNNQSEAGPPQQAGQQSVTKNAFQNAPQNASQPIPQQMDSRQTSNQPQPRQRAPHNKNTRTYWTDLMEDTLIRSLYEANKEGMDTESGNFTSTGWKLAVESVRLVTPQPITADICQNRWRKIKRIWRLWTKHAKQVSDWDWDSERRIFRNTAEVMEEYFRHHSDMRQFIDQGPRNREPLGEILDGKPAGEDYGTGVQLLPKARARIASTIPNEEEEKDNDENIERNTYLSPEDSSHASSDTSKFTSTPASNSSHLMTPTPSRKRSLSNAFPSARESRKKKSKYEQIAEAIEFFGEQLKTLNPTYVVGQAVRTFLDEVHELFEDRKKENGRVPCDIYLPMLEVFEHPGHCHVYLALRDRVPKEDRREWILSHLRE